jgi:hypothetical protein
MFLLRIRIGGLITDPNPDMQIFPDPTGYGSTNTGKRFDLLAVNPQFALNDRLIFLK